MKGKKRDEQVKVNELRLMDSKYLCPNCGQYDLRNHPQNACMLSVFDTLLSDRGMSKEQRELRWMHCDVGALWDDLGPIVDNLENGNYE